MKTIELVRVASNLTGTWGNLIAGGVPFALTLELPWINNEKNISCIPAGDYLCTPVESPRFGNTYEIINVPDRTHILFHKGNTLEDSKGCLLVGEEFGILGFLTTPAVLSSGKGFTEFYNMMYPETFELQIVDMYRAFRSVVREIK